jgi:transposase-like protein
MASTNKTAGQDPATLIEAVRYFADPDSAFDFFRRYRWPNGSPVCPFCEGTEHSFVSTRKIWKCKGCKRQFSIKVGTIFENSPLGLDKWLPAMWLLANAKNSVSSHELARALGVTQKTAWFMFHRIRHAMETGTFRKLDGTVEADETFVGGRLTNMHQKVRDAKGYGKGGGHNSGKTAVAGMVERGGEVRGIVTGADTSAATLQGNILHHVALGAEVFTDEYQSYKGLDQFFAHKSIDHGREYVSGRVHTNTIESFWALLKRSLKGTQVHVEPEHLHRYVTERSFAYNHRTLSDIDRMREASRGADGRRLTWKELTAK